MTGIKKKYGVLASSVVLLSSCIFCQNNTSQLFAEDSLTTASGWDLALFEQDRTTYHVYKEQLADYPLTLSAFPVVYYEYAVHSEWSPLYINGHAFIAVNIGDYPDFHSDSTRIACRLFFQVDSLPTTENSFIQSRNWPYLTAQGRFTVAKFPFDWVFLEAPDGNAYLMVNMKLFDLKNGQTVVIFPKEDGSFSYKQGD